MPHPFQTGRPFIPNQNPTGAGASLGTWAQWSVFSALAVRQGSTFRAFQLDPF
ncbi:MAG: hypothetical protein IPM36_23970 [Lewinellaceae bacterium]|nr:hypothetical protein [Lewinellaceae bacterium]